ncbi:MAG: hypothetical protein M1829_001572 [Trizodia sp. TS-e1964]|nr:MAG: hypothetical protein M1829_001572 [Trizodia sp. TS-e1964]
MADQEIAAAAAAAAPATPSISWPINRPAERTAYIPVANGSNNNTTTPTDPAFQHQRNQPFLHPDNLPSQPKSLAAISQLSFLLGLVLGASLLLSAHLLTHSNPLWRAPLFLAILALFHFLEYFVTARYNTRHATVSAFLLSQNGPAYNIAHTLALTECLLTNYCFPHRAWLPPRLGGYLVGVGGLLVVLGQAVRSAAMRQAGTNFNHKVQVRKSEGHVLVTGGVYAWFRHPSYFGFFWWGLGTQLVCGNAVCFVGYAVVLWMFFHHRIGKEEEFLVEFFGKEYEEYRARTRVGIPFIA